MTLTIECILASLSIGIPIGRGLRLSLPMVGILTGGIDLALCLIINK